MERNSRTRLTTAGILLLVFASGSLVGMAFDRGGDATAAELPAEPVAEASDDAPTAEERDGDAPRTRRRMIDRIDLSAEQRAAVDAIIQGHRARMDSLNAEFRVTYYPRYYEIVDGTRGRIMDELTDEQAATYEGLLSAWDSENPRDEREELPFRRRN